MSDIIIQNLDKAFGEKKVFDNFSALFKEGEVSFVMGNSGCGKTTLLNILMGLETADSGIISGVPEKIGAVFQEDRLCEEFRAVTNIRMVMEQFRYREAEAIVREHLTRLGFEAEDLKKKVKDYSGGMKRRVAIARAVLFNGDALFMDEPFKGLDVNTKKQTIDYVKEYTKGKTVIIVSHDREEAELLGGSRIRI